MTSNHNCRFRYDAGVAQELIEQMQSAIPQRWWCLAVLADAVQAAHRANPDRWGVTLRPEPIRLNVGMIEVSCFDSRDSVYLVLDAATVLVMPANQYQPYLTSEALEQFDSTNRARSTESTPQSPVHSGALSRWSTSQPRIRCCARRTWH
jgi:hypothetical protein